MSTQNLLISGQIIEGGCGEHLLEVGMFGVLNQLQQDGLGSGEVSSALLQTGQSKQTVRLAAEENTQVAIQVLQQLSAVHCSLWSHPHAPHPQKKQSKWKKVVKWNQESWAFAICINSVFVLII